MGWICRQCGSENRCREARCPACLYRAGLLHRLRPPGRSDAATHAALDRAMRCNAALLRLTGAVRRGTLLLLLAGALLAGMQALTRGDEPIRIALRDTWQPRWQHLQGVLTGGAWRPDTRSAGERVEYIAAVLLPRGAAGRRRAEELVGTAVRIVRDGEPAGVDLEQLADRLCARLIAVQQRLAQSPELPGP